MKLGDKISQLRKKAGLSQEELGDKLNVTRQTISKWELGQSKPDTDKLIEVSKLLNVDFNQLVDDEVIIENDNSNINVNTDEPKPRKWLLVVLIIVSIIIVIILVNKIVMDRQAKKENEKNNGIFEFFGELFNNFEDLELDDFNKESFNNTFEFRMGTEYGSSVSNLLDDVITNNKTNDNYLIEVVFGDITTTDTNEIKNMKQRLDSSKKYEVSLDYNDDGYVNKVTIETSIIVDSFDISSFNNSLEIYSGTEKGISISWLLDNIITSNKKNSDHIIKVIYGSTNTTDESEIRNIKKQLDDWTEYEVIFNYDDFGFINQVTIEK